MIALLKLIRSHVHKHDEKKQGTMSLVEHDVDLFLNYQQPNQDLGTFYKLFKARCDVIDTFGGRSGYHPALYLQHRERILRLITREFHAQNMLTFVSSLSAFCEHFFVGRT